MKGFNLGGVGESMKRPAVIVGIVAAVFAAIAVVQSLQATDLKRRLGLAERDLAKLNMQNQDLLQQVGVLQSERKSLDERVSALRSQLTSATQEVEQARLRLAELEDRATRLSQERTTLQEEVDALKQREQDVQQRLQQAQGERDDLQRSLGRMRTRLALLNRDYQKAVTKLTELQHTPTLAHSIQAGPPPGGSSSVATASGPPTGAGRPAAIPPQAAVPDTRTVELPPIIVRKDSAGISLPIRARVVEANDPHQFIIIDKGSEDGVSPGMTFDVLRGAEPVGRVTVLRVRPKLTACNILRARTPGRIEVGDTAVQHTATP